MSISNRTREQMEASSWIRRMFEDGIELKRIHGEGKVFDLSLGNPLLEPPAVFREELIRIAESDERGMHRYMPNPGFAQVRTSVAKSVSNETGLSFSAGEIVMTTGAAGAINIFLRAILNDGDEVVVFAPYFPEYAFYIAHQGGKMVTAGSDSDMLPDIGSLKKALSPKTRAIIINSPNNPTGVIYPERVVAEVAKAARGAEKTFGTEIYLLADEAYRRLVYVKTPLPSVFDHHTRAVAAYSHSKDLGLAGERIGYLAISPVDSGRKYLADATIFALRTLGFVNAPAIAQRMVGKLQNESVDMEIYRRKRDFLFGGITKLGYDCPMPNGAFYIFPKTPIPDDVEFVKILQSKLLLTVPGTGFGKSGYIRICYCVDDWVLEGALAGFEEAVKDIN